jgi:hypothetical protein
MYDKCRQADIMSSDSCLLHLQQLRNTSRPRLPDPNPREHLSHPCHPEACRTSVMFQTQASARRNSGASRLRAHPPAKPHLFPTSCLPPRRPLYLPARSRSGRRFSLPILRRRLIPVAQPKT